MELSTTSNQTVVDLEAPADKTDQELLRNGGTDASTLTDDVSSLQGSQSVAKKSRRSVASLLVVFLDALVPARTLVELATEVLLAALAVYVILSITGAFQVGSSPGMWRPAFRCDDPSLQSPFLAESVRTRDLAIFVFTLPPAMLLVLEFRRSGAPLRDRFFWSGRMLRRYLVGLLLVTTATQLLKDAVAEKRPYFLDACKPVFRNQRNATLLCQASMVAVLPTVTTASPLITDYVCSGPPRDVIRAFDSFPSGHSSVSCFVGFFLVGYLVWRGDAVAPAAARVLLVALLIASAVAVSLSRIVERMHFWWDVGVGGALGLVTAVVFVLWPFS
ncbi:phospholipid phosphatase homolog 1.2 homolog [Rhipicephalus sanguineus]|uniref:phospholipid phosphatase homolog 1.2 homolog n=1 Tax=Rhipicephalus sanguineus TaxID=34632 RepID=UPI0018953B18|nr:phospholipid phosphatase homolog 1.2 homolog [Rhipicephalus sanguineus]XP_037529814.1 phospholipid phosphatase homolog 1.2 homolog [Rhipicephalus sanguineus]